MLIKADGIMRDTSGDATHFVRFYDDNAVLLGEVADFLDSALRSGGAGIVIAEAARLEELRHRLAGLGSSPGHPAWYPGQLILLDAEQTLAQFMADGWPDPQRFAATMGRVVAGACAGGSQVHAFGEMVALLCAKGQYEAAVRLEQLWNDLAQEHAFSLFCAYPWAHFSSADQADAFERVCAQHQHCCSHAPTAATAETRAADTRLVKLEQKALALEGEVMRRKEAERTLRRANSAKDEFLAMLGHELRNPLSPIVTALQLMRMRGETGAVRERQIIERQVDHLVRLVDDLLDISRVTRGNITLQPEQVDIAQPLAKAVEMAGLLLEQRKHRLMVEVAPDLQWHGDPARLAQVVANLLTNAARYTEPGGDIALRAWREDEGTLVISVKDSGSGLAPEILAQVFDLFFQGKRSLDRTEGGLGVGLALVKSIVELHGGTVEAHSLGKGSGSEFIVRLPAQLAPALVASVPAATLPAGAPAAPRRIMIVDDNADAAEMLGRLLTAHGHVVEVFNDPLMALAEAGRLRPDIAVLDIGLPLLNGYELAARLRAVLGEHPCRLIALTGYGQEADKARSAEAGFELHLVKPVSPELIVSVVSGA